MSLNPTNEPFRNQPKHATCPRVPNQRTFSRMSCECATRPGAQAETLSGRLSNHLRVLSERDTCPRVPPADKTLRKPPELATRSECLNSKLPREPSESPRVPRLTPGESRIPPASPECAARSASDSFPRMPPVAPHVPSEPKPQTTRTPPGSPANQPRKTLPDTRRVRRVSIIPGANLLFIIGNSRKWL